MTDFFGKLEEPAASPDDEFGDFEEFGESASQQTVRAVRLDAPATRAPVFHQTSKPKPKPKPQPQPETQPVSIVHEISKMARLDQPVRFGQHLSSSSQPTSLTEDQWNELLSSTPGPRPESSSAKKGPPIKSRKPVQPSKQLPEGKLIDDEEIWGDFEMVQEQRPARPKIFVPDSKTLLVAFADKVVPTITKLLDVLDYSDQKQQDLLLSKGQTQRVIEQYLENIHILALVLAGRKRRLAAISEMTSAMAEQAAENVVESWQRLVPRIETMLKKMMPPLTLRPVFGSTKEEVCAICGLAKMEFVKGHPRPAWNLDMSQSLTGHTRCLNWWASRHGFGIA